MDTSLHSMATLFEQLGLAADRESIERFLASHRLARGQNLVEAPFWTEAQARFLREAWCEDADWVEQVDELAVSLSAGGEVERMIGRSGSAAREVELRTKKGGD